METRARLVVAGACLVGFGLLAARAHGPSVLAGDIRFARWVRGRDWPLLEPLTDLANWSMRTIPLVIGVLVVLIFIMLWRLRADAMLLLLATLITPLSYLLKELIASPRPTPELIQIVSSSGGYGFPGGRAGNAVLVAGALAWIATRHVESRVARVAIWLAAVLWTTIAGVARIRVGAHWPSDILGAWLWTVPALILLISLVERKQEHECGGGLTP